MPIGTLANGHELALHVHELAAPADGPTLAVVAGVMGDQPSAVETARRAALLLESRDVLSRGRVLLLPVANPYAYQQHARNTPLDQNNLNRLFPGRRDGIFSEQLAAAIIEDVVAQADVLLAMHSGGTFETTRYAYSFGDLALAAALGTELVLPGPSYPGTLASAAQQAGVRVVVSELGGASRATESIELGLRAIRNLLCALGMANNDVLRPSRQLFCRDVRIVRPRNGGVLLSAHGPEKLTHELPPNAHLGEIVSPYSFETLETFVAPFQRSLLALTREQVTHVEAGDYAFIVADAETAETLAEH